MNECWTSPRSVLCSVLWRSVLLHPICFCKVGFPPLELSLIHNHLWMDCAKTEFHTPHCAPLSMGLLLLHLPVALMYHSQSMSLTLEVAWPGAIQKGALPLPAAGHIAPALCCLCPSSLEFAKRVLLLVWCDPARSHMMTSDSSAPEHTTSSEIVVLTQV